VKIVRNYVETDSVLYSDPNLTALGCAVQASGPDGGLNHVEVQVSQNQIDLWATDSGSTVLKHLATFVNANLSFTRGVLWLEDAHYNAEKGADPTTGTPDESNHTFAWDNVAFDGPTVSRDLSFDVLDALQPTNQPSACVPTPEANIPCGGNYINLGWGSTPTSPVSLTTLPMTQANINAALGGPLLMFNLGPNAVNTFTYSINGNAHTAPSPFTPAQDIAYHSVALPVALTDLVPGPQTVVISGDSVMMVVNVNIVLPGAGGIVAPSGVTAPVAPLNLRIQ
jgi:hypothetical protein